MHLLIQRAESPTERRHLSYRPRMRRIAASAATLRLYAPHGRLLHYTRLHFITPWQAGCSVHIRNHPYKMVVYPPVIKKVTECFRHFFELVFANDGIFSVTFLPDFISSFYLIGRVYFMLPSVYTFCHHSYCFRWPWFRCIWCLGNCYKMQLL